MDFHANNPDLDLHVGNLPYHYQDRDLFNLVGAYGKALQVRIAVDRATGQSRGFGFVRCLTREDAERVIAALDGRIVSGRVIKVSRLMLKPRSPKEDNPSGQTR